VPAVDWGTTVAEPHALRREDGQATVELVAAVPALLLAALISLQLLAAGYALTLADGAAEAGALALAEGGSAAEAARRALPGWADDNVLVSVEGDEVSVRLRPPSPFGSIADHLAVSSSASARAAE
jgi:pilus assembly protein CpaE